MLKGMLTCCSSCLLSFGGTCLGVPDHIRQWKRWCAVNLSVLYLQIAASGGLPMEQSRTLQKSMIRELARMGVELEEADAGGQYRLYIQGSAGHVCISLHFYR